MSDEFDGLGGSYTADPKTGKRKLIERTTQAEPNQPVEPATEQE